MSRAYRFGFDKLEEKALKKLLVANTVTTLLCALISLIMYRFTEHRPNPVLIANFVVAFVGIFCLTFWSQAVAIATASVPVIFVGVQMTWIFHGSPTLFPLYFLNTVALLIVTLFSGMAAWTSRQEGVKDPFWILFVGSFPVLGIVLGWPLYFLKFRRSNLATA